MFFCFSFSLWIKWARATPWYNGQRFSVFYEGLIFIFVIIVLLARRLAGQHFWTTRWVFWYITCDDVHVFSGTDYKTKSAAVLCCCITWLPLQGATGTTEPLNDHKMDRRRSSIERSITERNQLGSEWSRYCFFFIALLCANWSVLLFFICQNRIRTFSTWAPPSGAETVSSLRAHEGN